MNNSDFKAKAVDSIACLRDRHTSKELALHLYEIYGMKGSPQSWIARVNACFNPKKPEFFTWCDIVNLMKYTGCTEPLSFVCDQLGMSHPEVKEQGEEVMQTIVTIRKLRNELEAKEQLLEAMGGTDMDQQVGARFSRATGNSLTQ